MTRTYTFHDFGINQKQFELIEMTFSHKNIVEQLNTWQKNYGLEGLDEKTRLILPLLIKKISRLETSQNSQSLYSKYYRYCENIWIKNLKKVDNFKNVIQALRKAGVEICLLKGISMLIFYYKSMSMRPEYSDIDILIKPEDLKKTVTALMAHGFSASGQASEFIVASLHNKDAFPKTYLHALTFYKDSCYIDVHWRHLKCWPEFSFDHLYEDMIPIQLNGEQAYVLSVEQQLVHIIVNGMPDPHRNLLWILDACFLFKNNEHIVDLNKLKNIAEHYQVTTFVTYFFDCFYHMLPHLISEKTFIHNDPKFLSFLYRRQLSKYQLMRALSFYMCAYLCAQRQQTFMKKLKSWPDFIKNYFGLSPKQSAFLFFIKKIFYYFRRKLW